MCRGDALRPSMRTLATTVDGGRWRWSGDEARRALTVTGVLAAARVAAPADAARVDALAVTGSSTRMLAHILTGTAGLPRRRGLWSAREDFRPWSGCQRAGIQEPMAGGMDRRFERR